MTGFVYAIGDAEGRVKIGWSADPMKRLAKIKTDSSAGAALLGLIPATRAQESEVHKILARWRLRGEWFRHEGPVAAFVAMLPKPAPRPVAAGFQTPRHNHVLSEYRIANGMTQHALAKALGISTPALSLYESGQRKPSPSVVGRMARMTAIPARELRPDIARHFGEMK